MPVHIHTFEQTFIKGDQKLLFKPLYKEHINYNLQQEITEFLDKGVVVSVFEFDNVISNYYFYYVDIYNVDGKKLKVWVSNGLECFASHGSICGKEWYRQSLPQDLRITVFNIMIKTFINLNLDNNIQPLSNVLSCSNCNNSNLLMFNKGESNWDCLYLCKDCGSFAPHLDIDFKNRSMNMSNNFNLKRILEL